MNVGLRSGFILSASAVDDSVVRSIAGLTQWYAADKLPVMGDGTAVAAWQDSSGNGFDVSQATGANQPLYKTNIFKGQPALFFANSSSRYLGNTASNPFASGAARTVFIVARTTNTQDPLLTYRTSASYWSAMVYSDTGPYFWGDGSSINLSSSIVRVPQKSSAGGIMCVRTTSGSPAKLRVNGGNATDVPSTNVSAETGGTGFYIGRRNPFGSQQYLDGYIAEIIAYSGQLADADCLSVEKYLAAKYLDIAA